MKVILSSGPWGWKFPWKYLVDWNAFDGVVMKSFTLSLKEGNGSYLRTIRPFGDGWINRVGLKNGGLIEAERVIFNLPDTKKGKVIPSIAIHPEDTYIDVLGVIWHVSGYKPKAIEINLSCPCIKPGWELTPEFMKDCVKKADGISMIAKIGPQCNVGKTVEMALSAGFAAIHLFNSYPVKLDGKMWGYSGPQLTGNFSEGYIRHVGLVRTLFPSAYIIAGGGIYSLGAAKRYINAGADALSIGSLCLKHPLRANKIAREMINL